MALVIKEERCLSFPPFQGRDVAGQQSLQELAAVRSTDSKQGAPATVCQTDAMACRFIFPAWVTEMCRYGRASNLGDLDSTIGNDRREGHDPGAPDSRSLS